MGSEARNSFEQISKTLLKTKLDEANEKILNLELELSKSKGMCAELNDQVKSLNLKKQDCEEKIRSLQQTYKVLCAQVAVKNDTIEQVRYSCSKSSYISSRKYWRNFTQFRSDWRNSSSTSI